MGVQLTVAVEAFPIEGRFVIARGAKTQALVVTATLRAGGAVGRGECVPYARYGESADSVVAAMESARVHIEAGADRAALQRLLPAGAARNALDCAMWDLEAKTRGVAAHRGAGLAALAPLTTAFTLSVGTPDGDASGGGARRASAFAEGQARGRGRPRAAAGRARRRAARDADRRRQRGLARGKSPRQYRGLRQCRRRADRTAAAGRGRRNSGPDRAPGENLRRRERPRPRRIGRAAGPLRRGQHQAGQDRRPDRGAGDGRASARTRLRDHGGLHGRHFAWPWRRRF